MPTNKNYPPFVIDPAGTAVTVDVADCNDEYLITGTQTITVDNTFGHSGVLTTGLTYKWRYRAAATYNGGSVKFHGVAMTATQALFNHNVEARYDGAVWNVDFHPDVSQDGIIEGVKLVNDTVTYSKIQEAAADTIIGNPTGGAANVQEISCTAAGRALLDDANAAAQRTTLGLGTLSTLSTITSTEITDGTIVAADLASGAVTTNKLSAEAKKEMIIVEVSFETGEQCNNEIEVPYAFEIDEIKGYVTRAIAAADNGTITTRINGVAVTDGTITCTASDALNTTYAVTPTALNTISSTDSLTLVCAKATAGGKVRVVLWVTRVQE